MMSFVRPNLGPNCLQMLSAGETETSLHLPPLAQSFLGPVTEQCLNYPLLEFHSNEILY